MNHTGFLQKTIELAVKNVKDDGGPFGAVIVDKQGEIIGSGQNKVTVANDPTAHAEIQAIREACKKKNDFQLTDCILYANCEPCPMCMGAIYWARIEMVYYAAEQDLAAQDGFDDEFIYKEINKYPENREIPFRSIDLKERNLPFKKWENKADKTEY